MRYPRYRSYPLLLLLITLIGIPGGWQVAGGQSTCMPVSGTFTAEPALCPEGSVSPICMRGEVMGSLVGTFSAQAPVETSTLGYGVASLSTGIVVMTFEGTVQEQQAQLRFVNSGVADRAVGGGGEFRGISDTVEGAIGEQTVASGRLFLSGAAPESQTSGGYDGEICLSDATN